MLAACVASSSATRSKMALATERPSRILARPSTAAAPRLSVTGASRLGSGSFGPPEPALADLLARSRHGLLDLSDPLVRLRQHGVREAAVRSEEHTSELQSR